jgi:DNA-binding CsgD family transcriptional regulator/N-acetylneuraminic acid mutarotase
MAADTELSERELEILRLVATGASNKQIAQALYISANTVKVHLRNIFSKIEVVSRTEATLYAIREGIAPPPAGTGVSSNGKEIEENAEPGQVEAFTIPEPVELSFPQRLFRSRSAVILLSLVALIAIGVLGVGLRSLLQPQPAALPEVVPTLTRWETRAPLPEARAGLAAAVYENRIYALAGETSTGPTGAVTRYDPAIDVWETLSAKPLPVSDVSAVLLGEKIYVPGGKLASGGPTDVMEVYNPRRDAWEQKATLPVPVSGYALAAYEGKMYLFGGWDGEQALASVYSYDPAADEWSERSSMPTARAYAGAAVAGGKVFVIGGWDGEEVLTANEVYYPQRDGSDELAWEIVTPLPEGRYGMGMTGLAEYIYLSGGVGTFEPIQYLPQTGLWQVVDAPPPQVVEAGVAIVGLDKYIYLVGGKIDGLPVDETQSYQAIYTVSMPIIQSSP